MSKLTDLLALLYKYSEADTAKLAKQLNERMRGAWVNQMSDLAKKHGCSHLGTVPKGADAKKFRDDSKRDAESVAKTYNRELANEIARLVKVNTKGNRAYYIKNLNIWQRRRDSNKIWAIGLNTDSAGRQHAFTRFYQMNPQIVRKFMASGPPAVCRICINIFAAGIVDLAYTQSHPFPAHYLCPHSYVAVAPARAECTTLWVG